MHFRQFAGRNENRRVQIEKRLAHALAQSRKVLGRGIVVQRLQLVESSAHDRCQVVLQHADVVGLTDDGDRIDGAENLHSAGLRTENDLVPSTTDNLNTRRQRLEETFRLLLAHHLVKRHVHRRVPHARNLHARDDVKRLERHALTDFFRRQPFEFLGRSLVGRFHLAAHVIEAPAHGPHANVHETPCALRRNFCNR